MARHFGLPPLIIGMVIIGFGTSAPELMVSALAAWQGAPGIALGNAYGSNIANIALILGLAAIINPIAVHSQVLRRELPILVGVTLIAAWQLRDGTLSRLEAAILLAVFAGLMIWTMRRGFEQKPDALGADIAQELAAEPMPLKKSLFRLALGLAVLLASSRILVWGAVGLARSFGVSNLIVGLTIVAIGTSLPELASSVAAARKNQHDLALGNIVGSNLFNTLAVVGVSGTIHPIAVSPMVLCRDVVVMGALSLSLFLIGYGFRGKPGKINRWEGVSLLAGYAAYAIFLLVNPE
jgi:cation:H+ antiporter